MFISEIIKNLCGQDKELKRGFCIRAFLPHNSDTEHICILISKRIKSEDDIVHFVWVTTKKDKVYSRLKYDQNAIVVIKPEEYSQEIQRESFVQCSKVYIIELTALELFMKLNTDEYDYNVEQPPDALIDKIVTGIQNSDTFSTMDLKTILA
jgi:hypothetical protein